MQFSGSYLDEINGINNKLRFIGYGTLLITNCCFSIPTRLFGIHNLFVVFRMIKSGAK